MVTRSRIDESDKIENERVDGSSFRQEATPPSSVV